MRKKIIINSNFNVTDPYFKRDEIKTKEWIDYRMGIFMKYTLKSFKIQTNQNFIYILKYDENTEDLVKMSINKYESLPSNVRFVPESNFKTSIMENVEDYDYVYITRIDNDDMLHKSFIQQLYDFNHKKDTKVLINQNGYMYNSFKNEILKISYLCPPFYTLIYSVNELKNKIDTYRIPLSHISFFAYNHELLLNYNYIWHIHSKNTLLGYRVLNSYTLDADMHKLITDTSEISKILQDFIGSQR